MDELTLVRELLASDDGPALSALDQASEQLRHTYNEGGVHESTTFRHLVSKTRVTPTSRVALVLAVAALVAASVIVPLTIIHSPNTGGQANPAGGVQMQLVASDTSPFQAVGADPDAFYLQCVTDSTCYGTSGVFSTAGSPEVYRTDNGGVTWVATAALPAFLTAPLACSSATDCMAAVTAPPPPGGSLPNALPIATTMDAGAHWVRSYLVLPAQLEGGSISDVACATPQRCVVSVGVSYNSKKPSQGAFFTTSDAGFTWTEAAPVSGITENDVWSIHCTDTGACVAVVLSGSVPNFELSTVSSVDFGANWTTQPGTHISSGGGRMLTACGDPQHCLAVYPSQSYSGTTIARTTDGGAAWTVSSAPADWRSAALDLSCPTGTDCYVSTADNSREFSDPIIETTTDGGATWRTLGLPTVGGSALGLVQPLSCPTVDGCLGVAALPGKSASLLVSSLPAADAATP